MNSGYRLVFFLDRFFVFGDEKVVECRGFVGGGCKGLVVVL